MFHDEEPQTKVAYIDSLVETTKNKKKIKQVRFSNVETFISSPKENAKLPVNCKPVSILRNSSTKSKAASSDYFNDLLIIKPIDLTEENIRVPVTSTKTRNEIEKVKSVSQNNVTSTSGLKSAVDDKEVSILWNSPFADVKSGGIYVKNIETGIPAKLSVENITANSVSNKNFIPPKKDNKLSNKTTGNKNSMSSSINSSLRAKPSIKEIYGKYNSGGNNPLIKYVRPRSKQQIRLLTTQIMDDYKRSKKLKGKLSPLDTPRVRYSPLAVPKKPSIQNMHAENMLKLLGPVSEEIKSNLKQYRISGGAESDVADTMKEELHVDINITDSTTTIGERQPLTLACSDDENLDEVHKTRNRSKSKGGKTSEPTSKDTGGKSIYFDRIFEHLDAMVNKSISNAKAIVAENDYKDVKKTKKQNNKIEQNKKIKSRVSKYDNYRLGLNNVMAEHNVPESNETDKPTEGGAESLLCGINSPREYIAQINEKTKRNYFANKKENVEKNHPFVTNEFRKHQALSFSENRLDELNSLNSPPSFSLGHRQKESLKEKNALRKARLDNFFNSMGN
ncbi:uncharacterized protein LOC119672626 isoform X1 [Teleopsis dalmanni]|uniref:uncharacterized protein LOC119672626 isoform X1 n=1 Tax=Teleopsis dalmanni TaxID=139649 RepID=UPI0018CE37B9|nr:uncharacterized protein LOC119672626 isoform X1 [Teleopsis dalmanni]